MDIIAYYVLITTVIYGISIIAWVVNCTIFVFLSPSIPKNEDGSESIWYEEDIQLRILTVNNSSTVRRTVESARKHFSDIRVIAEEELKDIPCKVHVVPNEFESDAVRKGRALEWARKNVDCDKEYVLYIDEDTIIRRFSGMPDADIIQFRETPTYSGSILSYLTEVYRIGYQYEQFGFGFYRYPMYAWGGGIAIRQSLEQKITWDYKTITEDTSFAWRASKYMGRIKFAVVDEEFYNQSPTNIRSLFNQRRRWVSGTIQDSGVLPIGYKIVVYTRLFIWSYSPFVFLNGIIIFLFPHPITSSLPFILALTMELIIIHITTAVGVVQYWDESKKTMLAIPLTVILSVVNSIGALWGIISPAKDFAVTKKRDIESKIEEAEKKIKL